MLVLIFAIISQGIIFGFTSSPKLNILFTFLFIITIIYLIEKIKENKDKVVHICLLVFVNSILLILYVLRLIDYGFFGAYVPVVFYFVKNINLRMVLFSILNIFIALPSIIFSPYLFSSYIQLFAVLSIPLFFLYNG